MDLKCSFSRLRVLGELTSHGPFKPRMGLYDRYVDFAIKETSLRTEMQPHPLHLQGKFKKIPGLDGKTTFLTQAFESSKLRLLRSMTIDGGNELQVLDFAVFPKFEFDLPIFCANFFSSASINIIVLDLNPLYNAEENPEYKRKYYQKLMPLAHKYLELLPWNEKITFESIKFFSPIVLWTKLKTSKEMDDVLWCAFKDYFLAWLDLMDGGVAHNDSRKILSNKEAQHRYLSWRAMKDPGRALLERLLGQSLSKELLTEFLFNGLLAIGSKTFLDYFPEYRCPDGTINKKRSMVGKAFASRPWDKNGVFLGM